jgi:hypothetical protein
VFDFLQFEFLCINSFFALLDLVEDVVDLGLQVARCNSHPKTSIIGIKTNSVGRGLINDRNDRRIREHTHT